MSGKHKEITWEVNQNGCWICTSHVLDRNGYPRYKINGRSTRLHRVIYEKHFGAIPDGLCVCHCCDTPSCINPEHLFLGTVAENNTDKMRKGRNITRAGEAHGRAKLSESDIIEILNSNGVSQKGLAEKYGICKQHVRRILKGKRWEYLFQEKGFSPRPKQNPKLTDQQVAEIRFMKGRYSQRAIAKIYGVSFQYISEILRGEKRIGMSGGKQDAI